MLKMQVENLRTNSGNSAPNQFVIHMRDGSYFKSYQTIIAFLPLMRMDGSDKPILDRESWDYSRTTLRYLKKFLESYATRLAGATFDKKGIQKLIETGKIVLGDLN